MCACHRSSSLSAECGGGGAGAAAGSGGGSAAATGTGAANDRDFTDGASEAVWTWGPVATGSEDAESPARAWSSAMHFNASRLSGAATITYSSSVRASGYCCNSSSARPSVTRAERYVGWCSSPERQTRTASSWSPVRRNSSAREAKAMDAGSFSTRRRNSSSRLWSSTTGWLLGLVGQGDNHVLRRRPCPSSAVRDSQPDHVRPLQRKDVGCSRLRLRLRRPVAEVPGVL